ncbi:MAG: T9SS type A sorting domain-containing protein [Vicingaceae bacterium]
MKFFVTQLFIFLSTTLFATTYTTVSDGNWNDNATWDANGKPGGYIGSGDEVIINHDVTLNQNFGYAGSLIINNSGSLVGTNHNIALYNGASLNASGPLTVKNYTLNSTSNGIHSSTLDVDNNLTIGNNSTLLSNQATNVQNNFNNNGGDVTFNSSFYAGNNIQNNNGEITFNGPTTVDGNINNNNSNAILNFNNDADIGGNLKLNSSSTLNTASGTEINLGGNFTANSGSTMNNDGRLNVDGNFANNGGTLQNDGVVDVSGSFTQNGGSFTNDGVTLIESGLTVNGGGTVDGTGILRTNSITNYGTIAGDNDICALDESGTPAQNGGGAYSAGTSYCEESASAALPIQLAFFKAHLKETTLYLEWKTLSETNNDYFTIEYSLDGKKFTPIFKEKGAGNSTTPILYEKELLKKQAKEGYYRLKQTDFDGKFSYSEVIYIEKEKQNLAKNLTVYPNPNLGESLFVELEKVDSGEYQIDLLASDGRLINSKNLYIEDFTSYTEVNMLDRTRLAKGVYFVRVSTFEEVSINKVIVK